MFITSCTDSVIAATKLKPCSSPIPKVCRCPATTVCSKHLVTAVAENSDYAAIPRLTHGQKHALQGPRIGCINFPEWVRHSKHDWQDTTDGCSPTVLLVKGDLHGGSKEGTHIYTSRTVTVRILQFSSHYSIKGFDTAHSSTTIDVGWSQEILQY